MWKLSVSSIAMTVAMTACGSVSSGSHPADGGPPSDAGPGSDAGAGAQACTQNTCTGGVLQICNASGMVDHTETCALGCFSDGSRCFAVTPSNGLGAALDQSAQQGAITLPAGAVVDSDTGAVTSAQQAPIVVTTLTVAQTGGAALRVLLARSWTINDVRVRGSLPVAFVSSDDIDIQGVIDVSADGNTSGAGALTCGAGAGGGGAPSDAHFERPPAGSSAGYPAFIWVTNGFGGGGFGSPGGAGGAEYTLSPPGPAGQANGNAELVPLRGGCEGGGDMAQNRGAGGGAVQLVSGRTVHLLTGGVVHVGGGRGAAGALGRISTSDTTPVFGPSGGGSGGGILIEAPSVVLDSGAALLAAGGGGGGWGACASQPDGLDAPPSAATGSGGACPAGVTPTAAGGDGATSGAGAPGGNATAGSAGSGGGGLGRVRINTADGQYAANANSRIRATTTTGMVGRH